MPLSLLLMTLAVDLGAEPANAAMAPQCKDGVRCQAQGECGGTPGTCHPTTEAHCRKSDACEQDGRCHLVGNACAAGSSEDCRASRRCTAAGACGLSGLQCLATLDTDCASSALCRDQGLCTASFGFCAKHQDSNRPAPGTEAACTRAGGRWEGTVEGRGRLTGCSLPTSDARKSCTDSRQCQSACVEGQCWPWSQYKGCHVTANGERQCVE